jgi:VCBS repeat-containing protein
VAAPGVLANDSDPDNNPLSAVLVSGPSHATLTLNPDAAFTYTPATNHTGSDSFTYQASDGTLASELATVTLTVTAANDPPTVTVAAGGTCGRDDHSGTINLTVADVESPAAVLTLSASSSSNPALVPTGNITFAGSGTDRTMTVSAVDGRSGSATLTVTVSDGQASGAVQVRVTVGGGGKDTLTGGTGADLLLAQSNKRQRHPVRRSGRRQPGRRQRQRPAHRRVRRGPLQRRQRHRHGNRLHRQRGRHQRRHRPLDSQRGDRATLILQPEIVTWLVRGQGRGADEGGHRRSWRCANNQRSDGGHRPQRRG